MTDREPAARPEPTASQEFPAAPQPLPPAPQQPPSDQPLSEPALAEPPPSEPASVDRSLSEPAPPADAPVVLLRRRRRWPWLAAAAGVVALAVIGTVVGVPLYRKLTAPPPTERVLAAAASLADAPALHLTGSLRAKANGSFETFDATVGADSTAAGTVSIAGGDANFVVGPRVVHLRADRRFLLATMPEQAEYAGGEWMETQPKSLNLAFDQLTPRRLAARLRDGLHAGATGRHAAILAPGFPTRLGSADVTPYRLPGGAVAFVTADAPYRMAGFAGTFGLSTAGELTAVVSPVGEKKFAAGYAKRSDAVGDAPVEPAHYLVDPTTIEQGTCTVRSCTESAMVGGFDGDAGEPAHVIGVFSSDRAGKRVVGTCQAKLPTTAANGAARVSCTTTSSSWRKWSTQHGGKYWFVMVALSPGWQGDSVEAMRHLLGTGAVTARSATLYQLETIGPKETIDMLDTLVRQGWSGSAALLAAKSAAGSGMLGVVAPMLRSGALAIDPETGSDALGWNKLPIYAEARRRNASGSRKLAALGFTDAAGKHHVGDLYDLSKRRVVSPVTLTKTTPEAVRGRVRSAAKRCRGADAPAGFGRELVLVASPTDPMYLRDGAGVTKTLRSIGLTGKDLAGIDAVTVVTESGAVAVHATDLG